MASDPREVWGDLARTAFVESSFLFRSLDPEARGDLLQIAVSRTFEENEWISPEGDDTCLILHEGSAAVFAPGADGLADVGALERGAFFGAERVLGAGRPLSLAARTRCEVIAFPAAVVSALSERFPKVKKLLEALVTARERDAAARLG
jgi:CRP-like cAMP-binding protein